MELRLGIFILVGLDYPDKVKLIELINMDETSQQIPHADLVKMLHPKTKQTFLQLWEQITTSVEQLDTFVTEMRSQKRFQDNIFDLFLRKFFIEYDRRSFDSVIASSKIKPLESTHFDTRYDRVYESNAKYPLYLFYQDYPTFQDYVVKEMKRHHDKFEVKITREEYSDENYNAIQSTKTVNKKLRLLYMNDLQKAIHYALDHVLFGTKLHQMC
jgi:hypothetical protein